MTNHELRIDLEVARRHICLVQGDRSPLHFLATDDRDGIRDNRSITGDGGAPFEELNNRQRLGYGLHLGVHRMRGRNRAVPEFRSAGAVYLDSDESSSPEPWPILPSLVISSSPGRAHYYWLTRPGDEPTARETLTILAAMCCRYGGTAHPSELIRTLRLAGSWHQKAGLHRVEIVSDPGHRYGRWELVEAFLRPPFEFPMSLAELSCIEPYVASLARRVLVDLAAAPETGRKAALYRGAMRLAQIRLGRKLISSLLLDGALGAGMEPQEIFLTIQSGHAAAQAWTEEIPERWRNNAA